MVEIVREKPYHDEEWRRERERIQT